MNQATYAATQGTKFAADIASGNWIDAGVTAFKSIGSAFGIGGDNPSGPGANSNASAQTSFWAELAQVIEFLVNPTRVVFVIIGIIMVAAAVFYFINSSKAVQSVTETVKPLADTASKVAAAAAV